MDELIDIVTQDGKPTGQIATKQEIHTQGHYHNTAHVWLYTSSGEVLLAQRSYSKSICPGLWDVSVAGHVDAGERIEQAAVREVWEEIGLQLSETDLEKIGVFECFQSYDNGIQDNEFHHTYMAQLKVDLDRLTPHPQEVEALKLVPFGALGKLLEASKSNQHFVASNSRYYQFIFETLKHQVL